MPLTDYVLEAKKAIQVKKRALLKKTDVILTTQSRNAAKLSDRYTPTDLELTMSIIEDINTACSQGLYSIDCTLHRKFANKIIYYFTKKGYVVAVNNKMTDMKLFWLGGKKWAKNWFPGETDPDELAKLALKSIIGDCKRSWNKDWRFVNPNSLSKSVTDESISEFIPIFKKLM